MFIQDVQIQAAPGRAPETKRLVAELRDGFVSLVDCEISAWAVVSGSPVGRFVASIQLGHLGQLATVSDELGASFGRLSRTAIADVEIGLDKVICAVGGIDSGRLVAVARSRVARGQLSAAVEWSEDALDHIGSLTGISGVATTTVTGPMFGIGWRLAAVDGGELEAMDATLDADATWLEMLEGAGDIFLPNASTRHILVRLDA